MAMLMMIFASTMAMLMMIFDLEATNPLIQISKYMCPNVLDGFVLLLQRKAVANIFWTQIPFVIA